MTICFFGYPNETYSRSKVLIDGLKKNRVKTISCTDKTGFAPLRYWRLFKKFLPVRNKVDAIFVQFPGHLNMPAAWIIGKIFRKPIIFDAFISLFDTYVFDRLAFAEGSLQAKFYWWVDKISCQLADKVTLDTRSHVNYFVKTFSLKRTKFAFIPVGGDDTIFKPKSKVPPIRRAGKGQRSKVVVEFHGMFTKLHGAEIFVKVAKKLEEHKNLEFWLIGSSSNYDLPIKLYRKLKPKNMKYWPRLPLDKLAKKIAASDICVGHLGPTQKAHMVVTNKMYHGLASGVALLAGACKATREFFKDRENCLFVNMYDPLDLEKKILMLAGRHKLRNKIAEKGYQLHQEKFTNFILGKKLKQIVLATIKTV